MLETQLCPSRVLSPFWEEWWWGTVYSSKVHQSYCDGKHQNLEYFGWASGSCQEGCLAWWLALTGPEKGVEVKLQGNALSVQGMKKVMITWAVVQTWVEKKTINWWLSTEMWAVAIVEKLNLTICSEVELGKTWNWFIMEVLAKLQPCTY